VAYELMEMTTGNLVAVHPTEEGALRMVAAAVDRGGIEAVSTLALGYDDPTGATDGYIVAEGTELAELALRALQGQSPAAVPA
jgi:hypothetical protein